MHIYPTPDLGTEPRAYVHQACVLPLNHVVELESKSLRLDLVTCSPHTVFLPQTPKNLGLWMRTPKLSSPACPSVIQTQALT